LLSPSCPGEQISSASPASEPPEALDAGRGSGQHDACDMGDPLAGLRLVFGAIGAIAIVVALALAVWRIGFMRARKRATAEVVSVVRGMRRRSGSGSTSRSLTVRVRFSTEDGSIEATDTGAMSDYSEGQAVTVYYDPAEPKDAVIAGLFRFWFLPALFAGLGSLFAALAAGL
jgi:hypothetical protein